MSSSDGSLGTDMGEGPAALGAAGGVAVRPEELVAAAARIAAVGARMHGAADDLARSLDAALAVVPGPESARAAAALAERWRARAGDLAREVSGFAAALRATAADLTGTDAALTALTPEAP